MRVCYLNHDLKDNTGAGRFARALFGAMEKVAPEVRRAVLVSESINMRTSDVQELGILYPNKLKLLSALLKIRKEFKKCDGIHALDGWPYGVIAALASLGLRKRKREINVRTSGVPKLIITAIGTGAVRPLYSWWQRPLMKWAYKKADVVTAISSNTKKEILKIIPDLKIEVINHGVDYERYQVSSIKYQVAEEHKPYILSVGTLKPRKGFKYSLEAFAKIAPEFPDMKYVIVGKGSEREALQLQTTNYKLQDRVLFLSGLTEEELIALYKSAELFILLPQDDNKDIEGFGLVFLEAAAAGLPVIGSQGTSAEDAVQDGKNGILVPPQDAGAAAHALRELLGNAEKKKQFADSSRAFAQSMSWEKAARAYHALY